MTETIVKEKPILFSAESVRAILDDRKSVTRRVIKQQPPLETSAAQYNPSAFNPDRGWYFRPFGGRAKCPFGQPGDRLWVRETWKYLGTRNAQPNGPLTDDYIQTVVQYAASEDTVCMIDGNFRTRPSWFREGNLSPIHMPRWASRITLEVTGVRVERLQEITNEDAIAEGLKPERGCRSLPALNPTPLPIGTAWSCPVEDTSNTIYPPDLATWPFRTMWDALNVKRGYGWDVNQWVFVIEFRRTD